MGRDQPRASRATPPERLILDSGAVFALARLDPWVSSRVIATRDRGGDVIVPVVVVAETTRGHGPRDARVNHVLKTVDRIPAATVETGRLAGRLLAQAESSATIDAFVVAEAVLHGGALVLTTDPNDLRMLADGHPEVVIQPL